MILFRMDDDLCMPTHFTSHLIIWLRQAVLNNKAVLDFQNPNLLGIDTSPNGLVLQGSWLAFMTTVAAQGQQMPNHAKQSATLAFPRVHD